MLNRKCFLASLRKNRSYFRAEPKHFLLLLSRIFLLRFFYGEDEQGKEDVKTSNLESILKSEKIMHQSP